MRSEEAEETEIATKTRPASFGRASEREVRTRKGRRAGQKGREREERAREVETPRRRSTTRRGGGNRAREMGRESPSVLNGDRILRMAKVAEGRGEGEEGWFPLYSTGARMRERRQLGESRREGGRGGQRNERGDRWDAGGGSRACWVDGCWYGFQEEREGEG